jgi:TRAP-type mannitol/chloroaromatic compound transport system substrate-binding protein
MQAHQPKGSALYEAIEAFCGNVNKMSGGRLVITPYQAGQLVPAADILKSVRAGIIEAGWSDMSYNTGFMPACQIGTAPFAARNLQDVWELYYYTDAMNILREAYAKQGVYLVATATAPRVPLISRKPVNKVADFKGLKVRSIGNRAAWFEALGASTVFIPGGEVYSALSSGTIDGATWADESAFITWGWHEAAKYIIYPEVCQAGVFSNDIYVKMDLWNALPPDLQAIVTKCGEIGNIELYTRPEHASLQAWPVLKKAKVTRCDIPQSEYPILTKAALSVLDKMAQSGADAKRLVDIMKNYMKTRGYLE